MCLDSPLGRIYCIIEKGKSGEGGVCFMQRHSFASLALCTLLLLPLAGCGATAVVTNAQATRESGLTVSGLYLGGSMRAADLATLEQLQNMADPVQMAQRMEALAAELDEFCAAQPGSFSVYLQDLTSGQEYTYKADTLYYPASTLKAPYALWLCQRDDAGEIDLDTPLPNQFVGRMQGTALEKYNDFSTIPARAAICAMIVNSDNNAATLLTTQWPAGEDSGFPQFLADLGFAAADTCTITPERHILGMASAADLGRAMEALFLYFDCGTDNAPFLKQCLLAADHEILYVPKGVAAAKKYGSWDYAYHDTAIVYAAHPYILVCMTDQGNAAVDFPPAATAAMQELGKRVYEGLND